MHSVFGKVNYGGLKHNSLYFGQVLPYGGWQSLIDFGNNCNLKMHRTSKLDYFNRTCKWVLKNHYKTWFKSKLFWVEQVTSIINDQKNLINMKLVWNFCWSSDKKLFESFFKINNLKLWKFGQIFVQNLAWKWNCKIQKLKIEREYLIFILFY